MTYAERERQPDTTTHDSIPAETGKNDGDRTSGDCISRTRAIYEIHEDADWLASQGSDWQVERMERDKSILMSLPSIQPERKTVFNRDIAIEAICDEVMLRFDVSATQAYEIADTAVKRIEVRMEKTERGKQK